MFPLEIGDINLLFALISVMLLVSLEMLSPYHSNVDMLIDKKKLRYGTVFAVVTFLVTLGMRMIALL